ncbi:MAG: DUF389 domain-containing protein, partial [Thermoleophilia bacterium]|nr:DUF389 domain-containing protein [Thermoleophilia bacterium]
GAMIVAPLMVPIQGTMLSVVIADRNNLARSIGLVVAGAASAVAIGYVVGLSVVNDVVAQTNSQVAGRVSPRLIDLLAALATGMVGSVALARRDISDTLPGVAIAISLVPPLAVVGICVANEAWSSAFGALVLFGTNVMAIVLASLLVFGAARLALPEGSRKVRSRHAVWLLAIVTVVVLASLSAGTLQAIRLYQDQQAVQRAATKWADERADWTLQSVVRKGDRITVTFLGSGDTPEHLDKRNATLAAKLQQQGVRVDVQFVEGSLRRVA